MICRKIKLIFILLVFSCSFNFYSYGNIPLTKATCFQATKFYEQKYSIPSNLLHSIALQESGRYNKDLGKIIPWPWSVNIEGKGHIFENKQSAIQFVKQAIISGKRNIDVGCMQVNLRYHPDAFKNLSEAFDPKHNVNYAALFLKEKYEKNKNWGEAISNYHSGNYDRGKQYKNSVLKISEKLSKKDSIYHIGPHISYYSFNKNTSNKKLSSITNNNRDNKNLTYLSNYTPKSYLKLQKKPFKISQKTNLRYKPKNEYKRMKSNIMVYNRRVRLY